jgi:L-rhamnonate dehydratase
MAWMEEMLPYWNYEGYRALRQRVPWQTMATGEHWSTRHPGIRAVNERLVDLIQADLKWIGGFTEALKLAHAADAVGIPMCLHTGANELYGQHWTFAAPNVHLIEYILFSAPGIPLEECGLASPSAAGRRTYRATPGTPIPKDGRVGLPPGPGFGIDLPEEWLIPWGA